jgi:hypothetical protein
MEFTIIYTCLPTAGILVPYNFSWRPAIRRSLPQAMSKVLHIQWVGLSIVHHSWNINIVMIMIISCQKICDQICA